MKELFIAGVFVFIALAGYWIFIWISAILIEKKIIKTVKKIIQFSLEISKTCRDKLLLYVKETELKADFPAWIDADYNELMIEVKKFFQEIEKKISSVQMPNDVKKLDENFKLVQEIAEYLSKESEIIKELTNLPARVIQMRKMASDEVAEFESKIIAVEEFVKQLVKDECKIDENINIKIEKARFVLAEIKKMIENDDNPDLIISTVKKESVEFSKIEDSLSSASLAKI